MDRQKDSNSITLIHLRLQAQVRLTVTITSSFLHTKYGIILLTYHVTVYNCARSTSTGVKYFTSIFKTIKVIRIVTWPIATIVTNSHIRVNTGIGTIRTRIRTAEITLKTLFLTSVPSKMTKIFQNFTLEFPTYALFCYLFN